MNFKLILIGLLLVLCFGFAQQNKVNDLSNNEVVVVDVEKEKLIERVLVLENENKNLTESVSDLNSKLRVALKDVNKYRDDWSNCSGVTGFSDFWSKILKDTGRMNINGLFVTNDSSGSIYLNTTRRNAVDVCSSFLHELSHKMYYDVNKIDSSDSVQWSVSEAIARDFTDKESWRCDGL